MPVSLPDGLIVVAKADCPTCRLVEPLLAELAGAGPLTVYVQDSADYAASLPGTRYDQTLEHSYRLGIDFVPTLIRVRDGQEVERTYGWHRDDWRALSGVAALGEGLPLMRPGCGSKTLEPGIAERLELAFGDRRLQSREIDVGDAEDAIEACYERGWSDGLPVVPPTPVRVLRMLKGTSRAPDEVVGLMPPDLVPCTVEKVAVNAPAISEKRLSIALQGRVRYQLKTPWRNGTTHVEWDPVDFIAKLAALVPPPRAHLTRFHGVFAPNAALRAQLTPSGRGRRHDAAVEPADASANDEPRSPEQKRRAMSWAQRLKRVFSIDVTTCAHCGGAVRIVASIEEPTAIRAILAHFEKHGALEQAHYRPAARAPPPAA